MDKLYKIFQLSDVFIRRYGFSQILLDSYSSYNRQEHWLYRKDDPDYQLIRITTVSASAVDYDRERINAYISYLSSKFEKEIRFLDLHISSEEYDETDEEYDHANIEEGYFAGTDLKQIYPEIYDAVHSVSDQQKEIYEIVQRMSGVIQKRRQSEQNFTRQRPMATYGMMILCLVNYLLSLYLSRRFDMSVVYVLLGADYMTFTLGLKQIFRFLTCGFVHGGILHLFSNMYSLYVLGNYVERRYGSLKYLAILFISVFCGSLSQAILSENTILVGLSGGLYGLMVFFILDLIKTRHVPLQTFLPLIVINVGINFMSKTAFVAHIGGMITGYLMYLIFNRENRTGIIVLLGVLVLCLLLKYVTIDSIKPLYAGTDLQIVQALKDLGFERLGQSLLEKLQLVYQKYGG